MSSKSSPPSSIHSSEFESAIDSLNCSYHTCRESASDLECPKTPTHQSAANATTDTGVAITLSNPHFPSLDSTITTPVRKSNKHNMTDEESRAYLDKFFASLKHTSPTRVLNTKGSSDEKNTGQQIECADSKKQKSKAVSPDTSTLLESTHSIIPNEQELEEYQSHPKLFFLKHLQQHLATFGVPTDSQKIARQFAHTMSTSYRPTDDLRSRCFLHVHHTANDNYTHALVFLAQMVQSPNYPIIENCFIRGSELNKAIDICDVCCTSD